MKFNFLLIFAILFIKAQEKEDSSNKDSKNNSILKYVLGLLINGIKNIHRISKSFTINNLFFKDPKEQIEPFKFTKKEKKILFTLAQLANQAYKIGDFREFNLQENFFKSIKNSKKSKYEQNARFESFEVFEEKTAFITDSLKGIIYTYDNTTAIAFKGTSLSILGIDTSNTSQTDKKFNNVVFNCKPNLNEIKKALYIEAAQRIYTQVKQRNPENKIILTGHSMGAAIASIIGYRNNEYVVAFASPGEKRLIKKLGYPQKTKKTSEPRSVLQNLFHRIGSNTIHLGDCTDSIYRGACNGSIDVCKLAGYNIETRCHSGRKFCYNKQNGFSILTHSMSSILKNLTKNKEKFFEINQKSCDDEECKNIGLKT